LGFGTTEFDEIRKIGFLKTVSFLCNVTPNLGIPKKNVEKIVLTAEMI
jgi:hypothetical protein